MNTARSLDPCSLHFLQVNNNALREHVFRLRYRVYCLKRGFEQPEAYPSAMETDPYDAHAIQFAAVNPYGEVLGTARLIHHSPIGLPLDRFLASDSELHICSVLRRNIGEVSRLAVEIPEGATPLLQSEITRGLYEQVYRAGLKVGLSHLVAAMRPSLKRLLHRSGLQFKQIGPEFNHRGLRRPYLIELAQASPVFDGTEGTQPLSRLRILPCSSSRSRPAHP